MINEESATTEPASCQAKQFTDCVGWRGKKRSSVVRFWEKVAVGATCWLWFAARQKKGYGLFRDGKMVQAHRWAYERYVGAIPRHLVIDHLCRQPACVRPDHLEIVTNAENLQRGRKRASARRAAELIG